MAKANCSDCRHPLFLDGKYWCRCHPNAEDHSVEIPISEIGKFECDEFISDSKKYCQDCMYFHAAEFDTGVCHNRCKAVIEKNDYITLCSVKETDEPCELFKDVDASL